MADSPGLTRRHVLAAATAVAATGAGAARAANGPRILVIGGGFAGAALAKRLRRLAPATRVTLLAAHESFATGPMSNSVLAGLRPIRDIVFDYDRLRRLHGVEVVIGQAIDIDGERRRVLLDDRRSLDYDRLVVAPGVGVRFEALGMAGRDTVAMPHAWVPGVQILVLRRLIETMAEDGTVLIAVPAGPVSGPLAPYERAGLLAHWLSQAKPRAKLLILDANHDFPGRAAFTAAWRRLYGDMVEWVGGQPIERVDAKAGAVIAAGTDYRPTVANIIPPLRAADLAAKAGLSDDGGWCPIDAATFASRLRPGIHVIGDAADLKTPKTAAIALAQAHACAAVLARELTGRDHGATPPLNDEPLALVAPDAGIAVGGAGAGLDPSAVAQMVARRYDLLTGAAFA